MNIVRDWFQRHFSNPQVVLLALLLIGGFALIVLLGRMLAPALAAVVIAYLLDSPAQFLRRRQVPHLVAVIFVFIGFISAALFALLTILPLMSRQIAQLVGLMPEMLATFQDVLLTLPERYPELIDEAQVIEVTATLRGELLQLGQRALQISLDNVTSLVTVVVYAILVPLMVFFFLKDKTAIIAWFAGFLPQDRVLVDRVWHEVDQKTGHYVRGKIYEILIVGMVTWSTFSLIDLQFAILLAVMTGLSVLIPFIGAATVFFPVAFVAFFQSGFSGDFAIAVVAYGVIQALDGNLLAPLLFSEVVKLHPTAIIVAILVFGGLWGFWGLFFAIPLATLAQAVLKAWPRAPVGQDLEPPADDADQTRP